MFRPGWVGWVLLLAGCDRVLGLDPLTPLPDAAMLAPGTWQTVAEGGAHACGIRLDGTLWCWGDGSSGQLGLGKDQTAAQMPTRVGAGTWKQVSAGLKNTCAIDAADALWCWGSNASYQLGDGTTTDQYMPEQVKGGPWREVAVGDLHVCAIDATGTAWCWGDNGYGELGQGDQVPLGVPTKVTSPVQWTAVTAATDLTCALAADQTAWCWGESFYGQIGNGANGSFFVPTQVDQEHWSSISAGGGHVCAILGDGRLRCWGSNFSGELGVDQIADSFSPAAVGDDSLHYTAVASGAAHTCATTTDQQLWCWGSNLAGQIDSGVESSYHPDPRVVAGGAGTWAGVAAGLAQTCGLGADHNLWCFGHGAGGSSVMTPTQVSGTWSQVSMGQTSTCGIATDGSLWCWGANGSGQLGDGSYTSRTVPTKIADPSWLSVSVATFSACALRSDHLAFCWGTTPIGDGSMSRLIPTQVVGGPYSSISAGTFGACAIEMATQALWCWGTNSSGQVGSGDNNEYFVPTHIGTMAWTQIASAYDHTCGLSAGTVLCWGNNSTGQLGDSSVSPTNLPTPIAPATSIAVGQFDSCSLQSQSLACWGWNAYGEVGDGTYTQRVSPTAIIGTYTQVAMYDVHVCAIATDGTLWGWGYNGAGELAQPINNNTFGAPIEVSSLTSWQQVAVGGNSTCATQNDSSLWCWGDNSAGQLGIGLTNASGPVLVP